MFLRFSLVTTNRQIINSLDFHLIRMSYAYARSATPQRLTSINLSCLRQMFRSGPLKGGLQEKMYFLLGCVRCASGKYDLNDRECDFRNVFGLLLEFILSLCLFWLACVCETDQSRSQSRLKKAKEIM